MADQNLVHKILSGDTDRALAILGADDATLLQPDELSQCLLFACRGTDPRMLPVIRSILDHPATDPHVMIEVEAGSSVHRTALYAPVYAGNLPVVQTLLAHPKFRFAELRRRATRSRKT